MQSHDLFVGVYPFLVTPFKPDCYEIDEARLRSHIEELIVDGKVHGITALGSTGEFALLSEDERRRVAEICVDAAGKRVPVIVGTSAIATRTAVALSQHAQDIGADGIIVNPQAYWPPTQDELFDHYGAIARAVDIPVMIYNNPGTTKVDMPPEFIARLGREFAHFIAVKESSGDIRRVQDIIRLTGGRMKVSIGHQSLALAAFALGAVGWTTGIANVIPRNCVDIFRKAVEEKDLPTACAEFYNILPLCDFFAAKSLVRAAKASADLMGKPLGPPRPPLKPLAENDRRTLSRLLADLGLVTSKERVPVAMAD